MCLTYNKDFKTPKLFFCAPYLIMIEFQSLAGTQEIQLGCQFPNYI